MTGKRKTFFSNYTNNGEQFQKAKNPLPKINALNNHLIENRREKKTTMI